MPRLTRAVPVAGALEDSLVGAAVLDGEGLDGVGLDTVDLTGETDDASPS
jgi:hypothetical protein